MKFTDADTGFATRTLKCLNGHRWIEGVILDDCAGHYFENEEATRCKTCGLYDEKARALHNRMEV